jgi:hypothetical protein
MKAMLFSKFTPNWAAVAMLLTVAGTSMSYGITPQPPRHETKWSRIRISLRFTAPENKKIGEWYQPPRSPGDNEDFGS